MDALLFLLIPVGVTFASERTSELSRCNNMNNESFRLLEGEAFYFSPISVNNPDLPEEDFTWYKNNPQFENITTEEENSIHYHGGALFFLNISSTDSGHYTARQTMPSGNCQLHHVTITVYNTSSRGQTTYGRDQNSQLNKMLTCPTPAQQTCETFSGIFTWYKDGSLLQGEHEPKMRINEASKAHEGIYTCMCTWTHNHREYNSSASRRLIVLDPIHHGDVQILSPVNNEQFVDKGYSIKLNCSIFCGNNVARSCEAIWTINEKNVTGMDGYHQTISTENENPSKYTYSTATLTIDKVSAQDFQHVFKCSGEGYYRSAFKTVTLKARESAIPLVIGCVCVLFASVCAAVLIKCFAIDLALFFRPFFPLSGNKGKEKKRCCYFQKLFSFHQKIRDKPKKLTRKRMNVIGVLLIAMSLKKKKKHTLMATFLGPSC
uniref:Ig-like domain-containing protein n=1 Tax=Oryzias latipes TaxID=8090 RepID=A0A3P9LBB5_ORYLA